MKRFLILLAGFIGAAAQAQPAASHAPELAAWLIGVEQNTLAAGEPLRVGVEVSLSTENSAPLLLTGQASDWRSMITVELVPGNGGAAIAAQPAGTSSGKSITIAYEEPACGTWWISSPVLAALTAGEYQVRVRLTSPALTADPFTVTLSGQAPPADSVAFLLAQAHEDVFEGNPEAAAKRLDAVLTKDASSVPLLVFRAQLALSVNDVRSARACLRRARQLVALDREAEPSVPVEELLRRVNAPASGPAPATPPPAWSVPPALVFASVTPFAPATGTLVSAPAKAAPPTSPAPLISMATPAATTVAPTAPTPVIILPTPAPATVELIPANLPGKIVPATALIDTAIIADASGQWAATARASSQYGSAAAYAPTQVTGAPNITYAGNDPAAWCPATRGSGTEWLEVSFARPVSAVGIRVRQNNAPGAIVKVEAIDPEGRAHVWWQGKDPYVTPRTHEMAWFSVTVPKTDYSVVAVRLTIDLALVADWAEIDAVQLVGAAR